MSTWKEMYRLLYSEESRREFTNEDYLTVFRVAVSMAKEHDEALVVKTALTLLKTRSLGIFALFKVWEGERAKSERQEVFEELKRIMKGREKAFIRFDDVALISKNVPEFKSELRRVVEAKGGISWLSKQTKQLSISSLSRFFKYDGVPRLETLSLISKALGMEGIEINAKLE